MMRALWKRRPRPWTEGMVATVLDAWDNLPGHRPVEIPGTDRCACGELIEGHE